MQAPLNKQSTQPVGHKPNQFPPLELISLPTVPTEQAAYYLNRRPQTLRTWAMNTGTGPLSCLRINGRLAWPVADLKRLLCMEAQ